MMPVQMVRSDIQDDRSLCLHRLRKFQLKTGKFSYDYIFFRQIFRLFRKTVPDIAAYDRFAACSFHDITQKSRRRRFAIRARNSQYFGIGQPVCDFYFTPDWNMTGSRFLHNGDFRGNDR